MGASSFNALTPPSGQGRIFNVDKKSRIQDTTVDGKIRLDAIARIVSEVSEDDLVDLGCPNTRWWMARKIIVEVSDASFGQHQFSCRTWAGGMARVAAERRVSLKSDSGASYESAVTWISIDPETTRPAPLPKWFADEYSSACAGRKASIRMTHSSVVDEADSVVWPLRRVDFDQHGHVNNGAYWPVIEEMIADYGFDRSKPYRIEIEFRLGVPVAPTVDLRVHRYSSGLTIWWVVDGDVAASATVDHLPDQV